MKTNYPDDDALSEAFRTWRVAAPLPPHFRDDVWRRIELQEAKSGSTLIAVLSAWVESVLPRPRVALCYVTTLLLVGMVSGLWIGQEESHRINADLGARYVQSVDPYEVNAPNR